MPIKVVKAKHSRRNLRKSRIIEELHEKENSDTINQPMDEDCHDYQREVKLADFSCMKSVPKCAKHLG